MGGGRGRGRGGGGLAAPADPQPTRLRWRSRLMETVLRSRSRAVIISGDRPFVMIGERINPPGRKVLAAEMRAGVMDRVRADAVAQVEAGAQMLDVNAGVPMVDEPALLGAAIKAVSEVTDVPICIDSSVIEALEAALAAYEGKGLVRSA